MESIQIEYRRYPEAKGFPLTVEGDWEDDYGFGNFGFLDDAGRDLRNAFDLGGDEAEILEQANAAYREWLKTEVVDKVLKEGLGSRSPAPI